MTYSDDMTAAPKDQRIIVLVPTGDPDDPISEEMAYWDEHDQRFEGEWRHLSGGPDEDLLPIADRDPIAWCALPEIPGHITDLAYKFAA